MNGSEFLEFADALGQSAEDAAALRTVTSRAYYGAFHIARQFLLQLNFKTGRDHGEVPRTLFRTGNEFARTAADLLSELQGDRIKADYKLDNLRVETAEFSIASVATAKRVVAELSKCGDAKSRQDMTAALAPFKKPYN